MCSPVSGDAGELALVVNATAGRGGADGLVDAVRAALRGAGHPVRVVAESSTEQTLAAVRSAMRSGVTGVVALGGDGLVHQLVGLLAETDVPLGVVPNGTGNDLAAGLGIPADPMAAVALITTGRPRNIDAVRSGSVWWGSVLCAGFDSAVNERANRMRWPHGSARYTVALAAELATLHTERLTVTVDEAHWSGKAILVAVGNTAQYGGGYRMCAGALPDDGLLDVVIVGDVGRTELLRMLPKVRAGTHSGHRAVHRLRGSVVTLAADGLVAYADGERVGPLPVTSRCVPWALRVWAPPR